ncbi:MAG: DUF362 domain-containing protein [Promethearchaeota archaeon]
MSLEKPLVIIEKINNLSNTIERIFEKLSIPNLNGKKVLIKPNVGREVGPKQALNTNYEVVQALYEYLSKKYNNIEIYVGDSPIIGVDTLKAFKQSGYSLLLQSGIKFLDLDGPKPIILKNNKNFLVKDLRVTGYFRLFDYIISVPVIKMHMHTGASLSFKNMKGLIYKRDKVNLHHFNDPSILNKLKGTNQKMKELDIAISDLYNFFKPDLALIDGTYVLEGMGPSDGNPVKMDILIASKNFLAADLVALKIVQPDWTIEDVPHLQLISKRFFDGKIYSIEDIKTDPEDITKFIHKIKPPPSSITFKYPNVQLIDIDSCSSCLTTVFLFLKNNKDFIDKNFSKEHPLRIAIGKGVKESDLYEPTFLVGNCTASCKNSGIFIKGCTPVQSKLLSTIKSYLKETHRDSNKKH